MFFGYIQNGGTKCKNLPLKNTYRVTANLKITSSEDLTSVSICSSLFPWSCKRSRFISMTNNRLSCSCSQNTPGLPWVWDGKTETAESVVLITWFWRRARCSWRPGRDFSPQDSVAETQNACVLHCLWMLRSVKWRKHKELWKYVAHKE